MLQVFKGFCLTTARASIALVAIAVLAAVTSCDGEQPESLVAASSHGLNLADPNLVAYWDFNEGTGTTLIDRTGKGNNGTVQNGTWDPNGREGGCVYFNGTNSLVSVPDHPGIPANPQNNWNQGTPKTFNLWYKMDGGEANKYVIEHRWGGTAGAFALSNALDMQFYFRDSMGASLTLHAPNHVIWRTWTMATVVVTDSQVRLYRDGQYVATATTAATAGFPLLTERPLYFGARGTLSEGYFRGWIDTAAFYSRALTDAEIAALYLENAQSSDLVGEWSFDEMEGATALDSSGQGNNGLIQNATWDANGRWGGSLYFNGTNSAVEIPDDDSWNRGTSMTYIAWYRMDGATGGYVLEHEFGGAAAGGFALDRAESMSFRAYDSASTLRGVADPAGVSPGAWTMAAAVVASGELRLYRDGQLVGTPTMMTGAVPVISGPLFFGARGSEGDGYFRGWIDEVKLYKRALTQAELQTIYQRYQGSDLVAHWSFDEVSGTTAADQSGAGHHGAAQNVTWDPNGRVGGAAYFNGTNSLVTIEDGSWNQGTPMTYNLWYKRDGNTYGWVTEHRFGGGNAGSFALNDPSTMQFQGFDGTGLWNQGNIHHTVSAPSTVLPGIWTMATLVVTPTGLRLYRDGVLVSTNSLPGGLQRFPAKLFFGARGTLSSNYFRGWIDDAKIWRRALSPVEVQALYAEYSGCHSGSCGNGEGPCTSNYGCEAGLVCGYGIGPRYGLPPDIGVCWDPGICARLQSDECGDPGDVCGDDCCVPECGPAGSPDGCGGLCHPCVAGADSDTDGMLDCDEQNDGDAWTDPLLLNGVVAERGNSCHAAPTCTGIDTQAKIDACFNPIEENTLYSGWDFATNDRNACDAGFDFAPAWTGCGEDFGVHYSGVVRLAQNGVHCFRLSGSTNDQCGALYFARDTAPFLSNGGAGCYALPAGVYPIEWFYETTSDGTNELHVDYCFGGQTVCTPNTALPAEDLRPEQTPGDRICTAGECSAICPCSEGQVCDPLQPYCAPGLECRTGVGDRFGLSAATPVCWEPSCDDFRSPLFSCGAVTNRCGLCPSCSTSCTGKSCGSDGCWGYCGEECGAGQAGCESDADCAGDLVCLQGAGARFGRAPGTNVCAPDGCRSLMPDENPCLDPDNHGEQTVCGLCPTVSASCDGRDCGPDGAGGECRPTPSGSACIDGNIVDILPYIPPFDDRPNPTITTSEVGTIPGEFTVSHTGEATYRMPLRLPRGRGGMTPELALSYRSGRGMGLLGAGWALEGMQSITRCERNYAQDGYTAPVRFDDSDAFCLNGERLVPTGVVTAEGATEYALERNDRSSILAFPAQGDSELTGPVRFEVTKPNGEVLRFGCDESDESTDDCDRPTNVLAPSAFDVVHTWPLARITDRDGNFADYRYEQERAEEGPLVREYYPTAIRYAMHPSDTDSAQAIVFFGYEKRLDPLNVWRNGVQLRTDHRLNQVIVLSSYQNRVYNLHYESGEADEPPQSQITSIQECVSRGLFEEPDTCLPATTFEYERDGTFEQPHDLGIADSGSIEAVFDYNGDGRDDLLVLDLSHHCRGTEEDPLPDDILLLSDTGANGEPTFTRHCVTGCPHCEDQDVSSPRRLDLQPIDSDGDGQDDDLLDLQYGVFYQQVDDPLGPKYVDFDAPGFPQDPYDQTYLLDLDGDGLQDLLSCKNGSWAYHLRKIPPGPVPLPNFEDAIPFTLDDPLRLSENTCPAAVSTSTQPTQGVDGSVEPLGDWTFLGPRQYAQVIDVDGDGAQELIFVVDDLVGTDFDLGKIPINEVQDDLTVDRYTRWGTGVSPDEHSFEFLRSQPRQGRRWLLLHPDVQTDTASVENTGVPWQAKIIDMNGDGLPDFYWLDNCGKYDWSNSTRLPRPSDEICRIRSSPFLLSWLNKGGGFDGSTVSRFDQNNETHPSLEGTELLSASEVEGAFRLSRPIDYDGDGKQDILLPTGDYWSVLQSTGTGFSSDRIETPLHWSYRRPDEPSHLLCPAELWAQQALSRPTTFDINGDGLPDLLVRTAGSISFVGMHPVTGASRWQVGVRLGPSEPRLNSITNGLGEDVNITYAPLRSGVNYQPKSSNDICVYPQSCRTPRGSVVSEYEVGTRLDKDRHYFLDFHDARYDVQGRGFLGYAGRQETLTVADPLLPPPEEQETVYTEYRFDNTTRDPITGVYFNAMTPFEITEVRIDSKMLHRKQVTIEAEAIGLGNAPGTVYRNETQRLEFAYEQHEGSESVFITRNWGRWVMATDELGNVTRTAEGVPDTDPEQTLFPCSIEAKEGCTFTAIAYVHDDNDAFSAPGLRNLPSQRTEAFFKGIEAWPWSDDRLTNLRSTAFEYDYPKGTLQRVIVEPGPEDPLEDLDYLHKETTIIRDDYGNVTKTTTIAGTESSELNAPRIEEIIYADDGYTPGWYPIAKINAKGQRTEVGYDTRYGELAFTSDPNGIKTEWFYDDFGRLALKRDGDRTETTVNVRESTYGPIEVETTVQGGKSEIVHYDHYSRPILMTEKGIRGDLVSEIKYDAYGRIRRRSRPHYIFEVEESQATVNFTFDARGREETKSWVDGSGLNPATISARSCYAGTLRCTRNARGFTSCEEKDQLGRTLRSWDPEPIANAETALESQLPSCEQVLSFVETRPPTVQYSYGEFLEKIEDAQGNVTRIKLDRYGRRVQLSDPDSGVQSTQWNAFGEVQMTVDANGQVMAYVYDTLGRTLERHDAILGPSETQITRWFYDGEDPEDPELEAGELIGSLTESRSPEGHAKSYLYNEVGQLTQVEQLLAGETEPLTVRYADYEFGRPRTTYYPDSDGHGLTAVRHNYGPHGHLLSVGMPQQTPFWSLANTDTDAFDLPIEEHFGNGAVSAYARDNLSRVRFMIDVDGNGNQIRLAALAHDAGGNVIARADANQLETIGYDQLDRLASSTINGTRRETHYDDLGNITFRTEVGSYAYFAENADIPGVFTNPIKPHAVSVVGPSLQDATFYGYDNAGQMIGRGSSESAQQMSWTPFGKISQMWTGAGEPEDGLGVVTFGYDADGERVLKTTEDETTTYMLGLYERRERADETEHVFYVGNDRRVFLQVAVRTDGNSTDGELAFMHGDVVGSPEVITGTYGSVVNRRSYGAFGAERDPNDWLDSDSDTSSVRRGFTGHEEDREYNLVNMIGRLYDARIGRFLSSDPFATLASSQHLNRYSYVRNNPLKYVDPSGYAEVPPTAVDSGEPAFNYTPSDDSDAEYDEYVEAANEYESEASANAASSETGSGSTPFSDPDADANADAMMKDTPGEGEPSESSLQMARGAFGVLMPDPLDCENFCAFAGPDFQDVLVKNAIVSSLRNNAQLRNIEEVPAVGRPTYVPTGPDGTPLPIPRGPNGELAPSSMDPHTQIGWQDGRRGGYVQTREFGPNGQPVKQVDWTDHGRSAQHTDPHVHDYVPNPTGGTPQHGPARPLSPGEL